jgi:hypothetical protein
MKTNLFLAFLHIWGQEKPISHPKSFVNPTFLSSKKITFLGGGGRPAPNFGPIATMSLSALSLGPGKMRGQFALHMNSRPIHAENRCIQGPCRGHGGGILGNDANANEPPHYRVGDTNYNFLLKSSYL